MEQITARDQNDKEVTFFGQLVDEMEDEHQVEARHPINTETLKLYTREDGEYVFTMQFQFDGMNPHHHEVHVGPSPKAILDSIGHPTEATRSLLGNR